MPYHTYKFADDIVQRLTRGQGSNAVHLDTNGVVVFPCGWMHPKSFRAICGEAAYQEILKRPRVQSEYSSEEMAE